MTAPRFDFFEKVVVVTDDPAKADVAGLAGAVLGRARDVGGVWSYAVSIYDSGVCWSLRETELSPTGEFDRPESFFDGSSVRITQKGERLDQKAPSD